jgi:hypothetical protein
VKASQYVAGIRGELREIQDRLEAVCNPVEDVRAERFQVEVQDAIRSLGSVDQSLRSAQDKAFGLIIR